MRDESAWRLRLANQGVTLPRFARPLDVVRHLGAVQAQDYPGGLWGIGLRLASGTAADVETALANRSLVRSWPMRGTLHIVAAADLRWMLAVAGARHLRLHEKRLKRDFGVDAAVLRASRKATIAALRDGRCLPRESLYQVLEDAGIESGESRGLHIVWALALEGLLCFGARAGKQHTFTLLEEWLPEARLLDRDEALATLARRYFQGHAPATLRDFTWWSGLTAGDAKRAMEAGAPLPGAEVEPPPERGQTYLLPAWDELTVGYATTERRSLVEDARIDDRYGVLNPVMIRRGRAIGLWKRVIGKEQVVVKPLPFARLTKQDQESLRPTVRRYGVFLGLPAALAER